MQITELRIRKVEDEGKLRAYVTITFDNCFVVHNVKIIELKGLCLEPQLLAGDQRVLLMGKSCRLLYPSKPHSKAPGERRLIRCPL